MSIQAQLGAKVNAKTMPNSIELLSVCQTHKLLYFIMLKDTGKIAENWSISRSHTLITKIHRLFIYNILLIIDIFSLHNNYGAVHSCPMLNNSLKLKMCLFAPFWVESQVIWFIYRWPLWYPSESTIWHTGLMYDAHCHRLKTHLLFSEHRFRVLFLKYLADSVILIQQ